MSKIVILTTDLNWKFSFPWYLNGSWKIKIIPHQFHGGKWNNTSNTMKLSLKSHDTDLQYMSKNHMNAIYTDGSKAAREKVNQSRMCESHVEAWEQKTWRLIENVLPTFGSKERLFSGLIKIIQRIWSVKCKR